MMHCVRKDQHIDGSGDQMRMNVLFNQRCWKMLSIDDHCCTLCIDNKLVNNQTE